MIKRICVLSVLILLLMSSGYGVANFLQQIPDAGEVSWEARVIRATGIGAPRTDAPPGQARATAITAARVDAQRKLLETIEGVMLTSETTVENAMVTGDIIKTRVEGILANFRQVGEPHYMSDGSVELVLEVAMAGDLMDAVLPPTGAKRGQGYTGMIVDATGLGVGLALAPRVLDEEGEEVYGPDWVDREAATSYGIVEYAETVEKAKANPRVGENPLMIKGIRASGSNRADVVIPNSIAVNLASSEENLIFMDQCRVIFVID